MVWKPHVTVAAIIEMDNKFLLVEEQTQDGIKFNQPAGHLEENEDIVNAVKREVMEETAWKFEPESVVGIQLWRKSDDFPTFLRFNFTGLVHSFDKNQPLDTDIITTHWLSLEEIQAKKQHLRSPLILDSIQAYLNKIFYPLSIIQSYLDCSK